MPRQNTNQQKQIGKIARALSMQIGVVTKLVKAHPIQIAWVSRKRAAELYGVSCRTIYNWKESGKLLSKEINGKIYYSILPLTKNEIYGNESKDE